MWKIYAKKFVENLFTQFFIFSVIGVIGVLYIHEFAWIPLVCLLTFTASLATFRNLIDEYVKKYKTMEDEYMNKYKTMEKLRKEAEQDTEIWKQSLKEKSAGFPTLLKAVEEYTQLRRDEPVMKYLSYKKHPAQKASDIVKEEARRRRQAEYAMRNTQAIIEYYETIAPFLVDFKNEILGVEDEEKFREYTEEEQNDPATLFLAKEEYRKLSTTERNQLALDRFWGRPKSNWLLGRIYERYVGHLYEEQGYEVDYVGIFKGYEDLGRDLICTNQKEIVVIQCKNWSQFKTIYEKHIFQFFGTVFQYKDEHPHMHVRAIFYTTTSLSELARRFAKELGIELQENCKLNQGYPCIKCNISRVNGEKIYHLPFDQQYDSVKIENSKGEFYCRSVAEAEQKGFRRAFRWRGENSSKNA